MTGSAFRLGRRIARVEALPNYHLRLTYDDGFVGSLDFRPYIEWGEVAKPLLDPELFRQARVGTGGTCLAWSDASGEEIDFCADALRMDLEGLRIPPHAQRSAAE